MAPGGTAATTEELAGARAEEVASLELERLSEFGEFAMNSENLPGILPNADCYLQRVGLWLKQLIVGAPNENNRTDLILMCSKTDFSGYKEA